MKDLCFQGWFHFRLFDSHTINEDVKGLKIELVDEGETIDLDSRNGKILVNMADFKKIKRYNIVPTLMGSGVPGQYLQEAFRKYSPVPDFLRFTLKSGGKPSLPPTYSAYTKGKRYFELQKFINQCEIAYYQAGTCMPNPWEKSSRCSRISTKCLVIMRGV